MVLDADEPERSTRLISLRVRDGVEPAEVPTGADQRPLGGDFFESAQRELSKAHTSFEISEHRFDGAFAPRVDFSSRPGFQSVAHERESRCIVFRRDWFFPMLEGPLCVTCAARTSIESQSTAI